MRRSTALTHSNFQFVDPHLLASVSDLKLLAQRVVDGFLLGLHHSPRAGLGQEFSQYRSYEPGDDLRRVDWKTYARSDRFYVRECEVEAGIAVRVVLDASASMAYAEQGFAKLDYARFLAACLGYLCHRQRDALGLVAASGERIDELPPRLGRPHWHRFLRLLEEVRASDRWPPWRRLETRLLETGPRQLIVVVSDLYEHGDEWGEALRKLAVRHEVLVFQLMGGQELDFPFRGSLSFRDLETGQRMEVDAAAARQDYLARLDLQLRGQRRRLADLGIQHQLLRLDQPLEAGLRGFLERRAASR